jgi:polar amino acid transport system substrate-binding protein
LGSGKFNLIADTNITATREVIYDQMSEINDHYTLATLNSDPSVGSTSLLDLCGMTLASLTGDEVVGYLQTAVNPACTAAGKHPVQQVQLPSLANDVLAVSSGRAAAVVGPASVMGYFLTTAPGKNWKTTGPAFLQEDSGYSVLKSQGALMAVWQKALEKVIQSGTYDQILAKYGQLATKLKTAPQINPPPIPAPS